MCAAIKSNSGPLCGHCESHIQYWIGGRGHYPVHINERHVVRYLFHWTRENGVLISRLIYALKNGAHQELMDWLADQFLAVHSSQFDHLDERIFIPAPGKTKADHADCWANALGSRLGGATWRPTLRDGEEGWSEQKGRSRSQRRGVVHLKRVKKPRGYRALSERRKFVFCDDVYTTGSTAEATMKHLQGGTKLVFAIAYRARLGPF